MEVIDILFGTTVTELNKNLIPEFAKQNNFMILSFCNTYFILYSNIKNILQAIEYFILIGKDHIQNIKKYRQN